MAAALVFTVPGEVRGKGRPRIVKIGGFSRLTADAKTVSYENRVAHCAVEAMKAAGMAAQHFTGPVCVEITARIVPAASASRKATAAMLGGESPPTKKPDWDNIGKITDALNGIVWRDDAQVVDGRVRKVYAEAPGLDVVVSPFNPAREGVMTVRGQVLGARPRSGYTKEIKVPLYAGQDHSIPHADDHDKHLRLVFAAQRGGFFWKEIR